MSEPEPPLAPQPEHVSNPSEKREDLEFLAAKSREILDKQLASYHRKASSGNVILTIVTLFIPLFLSSLGEATGCIKYLTIGVLVLFLGIICILLYFVFRSQLTSQAFGIHKFEELANKNDYNEVLVYEISANKSAFIHNQEPINKRNRYYDLVVTLTIIALLFSTALLVANNLVEKPKEPTRVEIVNKSASMNGENIETGYGEKRNSTQPEPTIQQHIDVQNVQNQTIINK